MIIHFLNENTWYLILCYCINVLIIIKFVYKYIGTISFNNNEENLTKNFDRKNHPKRNSWVVVS